MKLISIEFKEVRIGKFFPKDDKIELGILFNDGSDKEIFRTIEVTRPEEVAEEIFSDIKKLEKKIHSSGEEKNTITDNFLNIIVKDEENIPKNIESLIRKAKAKMDEIKNKDNADGYLDLIRDLKNLKLEF